VLEPKFATAPKSSWNWRIPALVLAPPLPPVGKLFTQDSEGVLEVSSLKTTTELPLGLLVLVSTKTPRSCGSETASAVANNVAASTVPARQEVDFWSHSRFIVISLEVMVNWCPGYERGYPCNRQSMFTDGYSVGGQEKLRF